MLKKRHKSRTADEIRSFMSRFRLESESNVENQLQHTEQQLAKAEQRRTDLDQMRATQTHPTDVLRSRLRQLSTNIETIHQAIMDSVELIAEYNALRAELITAKTKSVRIDRAKGIFDSISCKSCPECGTDISNRPHIYEQCRLCGSRLIDNTTDTSQDLDVLHQEFTERIEQITDSINRREHKLSLMKRELTELQHEKKHLDKQLEEELARYDSVFIENIRASEREIATLVERLSSLRQHRKMSKEVTTLEEELDSLQRRIDVLKTSISKEQDRLHAADVNVLTIKEKFKQIMLSISFPEVSKDDNVIIDPETWNPKIVHGEQEWDFWVAGSGGKKTLFNVCYALALHSAALERDMPVPNVLIIDSPTKNISRDMNPEQVRSLYAEIYRLAKEQDGHRLQFLLIDSDLIEPSTALPGFLERRMAGEPDAPSLISYYIGP